MAKQSTGRVLWIIGAGILVVELFHHESKTKTHAFNPTYGTCGRHELSCPRTGAPSLATSRQTHNDQNMHWIRLNAWKHPYGDFSISTMSN